MADAKQILFIQQDDLLLRTLGDPLTGQGYQIVAAPGAEDGPWPGIGLILVDSSADPLAVCRALREREAVPPLLALAQSAVESRALLDAGASECLVKPVRLAVLAARVGALFRSSPVESQLCFGELRLRPTARLITLADGQEVALTEMETAILLYLHRAAAPVPREELLGEVWGYAADASTHTVETYVYRLRRKLGEGVLLTDAGGYRLAP